MGGAETLFFLLCLGCWQGAQPHHPSHLLKGSLQPKSLKNSGLAPRSGHGPAAGRRAPSQLHRAAGDQLPGARNQTVQCLQLLRFLQWNTIIVVCSVAGILVLTLLVLTILNRKKQALYPPANMTYNIFIMSGKTWWQKPQGKSPRSSAGPQKQLGSDSRT